MKHVFYSLICMCQWSCLQHRRWEEMKVRNESKSLKSMTQSNLVPWFKFKQKIVKIPVVGVIGARIENSDHNKNMLEMRSDVLWSEGKRSRLLKHNGDYVISNMSFSQELQQKNKIKMSC